MHPNLIDAQEMAHKYPNTFEAPSAQELANIMPGDFIKICVEPERFWVKITAINPGLLTGVISNDLVYTNRHGLDCDQIISVEPRHVYAIMVDKAETLH